MMKRLSYLILLFWTSHALAQAQPPSVYLSIDSTEMLVGGQQVLRIGIEHERREDDIKFNINPIKDTKWEILSSSFLTHKKTNSGYNSYKDILLTCWEQGEQVIPSIEVSLMANGKTQSFLTDSIKITVITPENAGKKMMDIKDIYRMPFPLKTLIYILVVALIAVFLFYILFIYLKNKKRLVKPEEKVVFIPPDPAHIIAFKRLDKLSEKRLVEQGLVPEFQSELTHIIRQFLGSIYKFNALESTTDEIIGFMNRHEIYAHRLPDLKRFLSMADLIKFAKAKPEKTFHKEMLEFGYKIINELKGDAIEQHFRLYGEDIKKEEE